MRLTRAGLEDLLASLAELLEQYGVALDLAAGEELILGANGTMSAAEIEVTRSFRDSG